MTTATSYQQQLPAIIYYLSIHFSAKLDASGAALGRRYARMDEVGAPFGVTVDFQTVEDATVTLRERDSMTQIRMPLADVAPLVARLVTEEATWEVGGGEGGGWARAVRYVSTNTPDRFPQKACISTVGRIR